MIQNFNFYDVYGYLLPGITLLLVFWLPYGITTRSWPSPALASALFAVAVAYVAGHLLQILGRNAIPSTLKDHRYPSDIVLDDSTFTDDFKKRLKKLIKEKCGIDLKVPENQIEPTEAADHEAKELSESEKKLRGRLRADAFFMCRNLLVQSKAIAYAEQSEGMYALLLGLTVAFGLGGMYHLGWSVSGWINDTFKFSLWIGMVAALLIASLIVLWTVWLDITTNLKPAKRIRRFRLVLLDLVIVVFLLGCLLGAGRTTYEARALFLIVGLSCIFAALLCFNSYRYFIKEFAKAVYYAFSTYSEPTDDKSVPEHL